MNLGHDERYTGAILSFNRDNLNITTQIPVAVFIDWNGISCGIALMPRLAIVVCPAFCS